MPEDEDSQLLAAFARGDRDALGRLALRYESALLGLAMGMLGGSRSMACDAVQETWVKVIRAAARFRGQSSVKTWLYRIAINECKDLRRRKPGDTAPADANAAAPEDRGEETSALMAAMETLDEDKRTVLLLCYHDGMRHEQAADILGVPVGTLKSRLHAALRAMRERMIKGVAT